MKYIILLNIVTLFSCQRILDDTHTAEQLLRELETCEVAIEKDLNSEQSP